MTTYNLTAQDQAYLDRVFLFRRAEDDRDPRYSELHSLAYNLAYNILTHFPPSRERSLALTNLEQSVMWARESLIRNE